jgi:hypothetical protein
MVSWASFGLSRAHYRAPGVKIANPGMRELGERGSRALTKNERLQGYALPATRHRIARKWRYLRRLNACIPLELALRIEAGQARSL